MTTALFLMIAILSIVATAVVMIILYFTGGDKP